MRRFITYCLAFAVIVAAVLLALEWAVRMHPNVYAYKHQYLLRHHDEVETVILGNSHTLYGINPELIPGKAFNLANFSQTFDYDLLLLQKYAPYKSLKTVIAQVSYSSFFDPPIDDGKEWVYSRNYRIYMDINKGPLLSKYNWELSNFNFFKGKVQKTVVKRPVRDYTPLGQGINTMMPKRTDFDHLGRVIAKRHKVKDYRWVDYNVAVLQRIIDYCHQNGWRLILITPPAHKEYRKVIDQQQYKKMMEIIATLQARNSACLEYKSYFDSDLCDTPDFRDPDHLYNGEPADRLTRLVVADFEL